MSAKARKKTIEIGKVEGRRAFVEVEIEEKPEKGAVLSICGNVHGGGGGQNREEIAAVTEYAPGWDAARLARLIEVWRGWHLNDMKAGCQHQRVAWDPGKPIERVTYSIDWDVRRQIERSADRDIAAACAAEQPGAHALKTPTQRRQVEKFSTAYGLLALLDKAGIKPFGWAVVNDARLLGILAQWFEFIAPHELKAHHEKIREWDRSNRRPWMLKGPRPLPPIFRKVEKKAAGWVEPGEHPDGLLMKPCETCGYKYGSRWLFEPLPADVIAFVGEIMNDTTPDIGSPYEARAAGFLARFGLHLDIVMMGEGKCPARDRKSCKTGKHEHGNHYRIAVKGENRKPLAFDFWGSVNDACEGKDPTPYDVLACIGSDIGTPEDPDEVAEEFGEMPPSQAVAAVEHGKRLREFFTEAEAEALQEIS